MASPPSSVFPFETSPKFSLSAAAGGDSDAARAATLITSSALKMFRFSSSLSLFRAPRLLLVFPSTSSVHDRGEDPPSSSATSKLAAAMLFSLTDAESCQNLGFIASAKDLIGGCGESFFFLDAVDDGADDGSTEKH